MDDQLPPTDPHQARIYQDTAQIRRENFVCHLKRRSAEDLYTLVVELQRPGATGLEQVLLYLTLANSYPETPPEVLVTRQSAFDDRAELVEKPLPMSLARLGSWSADIALVELVRDAAEIIGHLPAQHLGDAAGLAGGNDPQPTSPKLRSLGWLLPTVAAILLALSVGAAIALNDPCGASAREAAQLRGTKRFEEAIQGYVTLVERGQAGERGSCADMATEPAALREAYLAYGARLVADQELASLRRAAEIYAEARRRTPDPAVNDAISNLITQLWPRFDTSLPQSTVADWEPIADRLDLITSLSASSSSPFDGALVGVRRYEAYRQLGDLHFQANAFAQARAAYEAAVQVRQNDSAVERFVAADELTERLDRLELQEALGSMTLDTAPQQLEELEQRVAAAPEQQDPAGFSAARRLFEARKRYSDLLLNAGEYEAAFAQADAARALRGRANDLDDAEISAFFEAIRASITSALGTYRLEEPRRITPKELGVWLSGRGILETPNESKINLLITTNVEELALVLTDQDGQPTERQPRYLTDKERPKDAIVAVRSGNYRLVPKLDLRDEAQLAESSYNYIELSFSELGGEVYQVGITMLDQP